MTQLFEVMLAGLAVLKATDVVVDVSNVVVHAGNALARRRSGCKSILLLL